MVSKMYKEMYSRWLAANLDDPDLKPELESIQNDDAAIQDRFAVALKFGTAGLRGVIGAGTNRMNVYVVRQATQGLANWVKTQGGTQTVAISYDSRIKSDVFAKAAAEVLAANGVKVRIYSALMPVPALSFATRYYNCNAGIMVTASHNPAKYNGYKAYGPDGCQMTDEAADIVYAEIQKTDILTGAKTMPFAEGLEKGIIEYVGDDCINALYEAIEARSIRPGICKTAGLKLVYSPLNGSGLVPVTHVLHDIGITDITVVPEQEKPDGNFPTCPYPNPEIFEALRLGLELAEKCWPLTPMLTALALPLSARMAAMSCFPATKSAFCCWITSARVALSRGPCPKTPSCASPSCPPRWRTRWPSITVLSAAMC